MENKERTGWMKRKDKVYSPNKQQHVFRRKGVSVSNFVGIAKKCPLTKVLDVQNVINHHKGQDGTTALSGKCKPEKREKDQKAGLNEVRGSGTTSGGTCRNDVAGCRGIRGACVGACGGACVGACGGACGGACLGRGRARSSSATGAYCRRAICDAEFLRLGQNSIVLISCSRDCHEVETVAWSSRKLSRWGKSNV